MRRAPSDHSGPARLAAASCRVATARARRAAAPILLGAALVVTPVLPAMVSAQPASATLQDTARLEAIRDLRPSQQELVKPQDLSTRLQAIRPQDRVRIQQAIQNPELAAEKLPQDTRRWEAVDTGSFIRNIVGRVVIPPDSLRVAKVYRRDGEVRLEAPLVEIQRGGERLSLDLSVDADPGLTCSVFGCEGTVQIGVVETEHPYDEIRLPAPMHVQLHGVDSVGPTPLTLRETRLLHAVRVRSRTPEATLSVRPDGLPSIDVPLPVRTFPLRIRAASRSMDAWGLEKVDLHISRVQGLDPRDTVTVQLQGDGLRVEPSTVELTARSGATVQLRSRQIGSGVVVAGGPLYIEPAEATIEMKPPWLFFAFALLGGLIGAIVGELRRAKARPRGRQAAAVAAGALFGVIMATLTALGANLSGFPLPTGIVSEILAFAEAGFFAFMMDAIVARLSGGGGGGRQAGVEPVATESDRPRQPA